YFKIINQSLPMALAKSSVLTEHLPIRRNSGKGNGHGNGHSVARQVEITRETLTLTEIKNAKDAKVKGYEGDPCPECKQFTMVRNGTCLKCVTCGATSGCS
ncbi:MAG: hypothetical protein ABL983_20320, partial [Nitrospira sp.]